jgi:hypothetical protein
MDPTPYLSPYALTSLETALTYTKRDAGREPQAPDLLTLFINGVTGKMEDHTGRNLRARTYRSPVTIAGCVVTNDSRNLTGAGFLALKKLDDALATTLAMGTRVESIENDAALTLNRKATGTTGAVAVTFGSEPLLVDGSGESVIYLPNRPIVEIYSIGSLDADGAVSALNITGARLDKATGRYELTNDRFPKGWRNIQVEYKAGVVIPSATERGHWREWEALQALCLRGVQVAWQDYMGQAGRSGDVDLVKASQHIVGFELPADIRDGLNQYRQPW